MILTTVIGLTATACSPMSNLQNDIILEDLYDAAIAEVAAREAIEFMAVVDDPKLLAEAEANARRQFENME